MKLRLILLTMSTFTLAAIVTGCASGSLERMMSGMDDAERAFNQRAREESVYTKTAEELFANAQVVKLAKAAARGDIEQMNLLVSEDVDLNYTGFKGVTPLFYALQDIEGFKHLLVVGADPNRMDETRQSPISRAVEMSDPRFLRAALAHGGNPNIAVATWQIGSTNSWLYEPLLHTAVGTGDVERIVMLLDAGADIDAKDSWGDTALLQTADRNDFAMMQMLLDRGADYMAKDRLGLDLANRLGRKKGQQLVDKTALELEHAIAALEGRGVEVPAPDVATARWHEAAEAFRKAHGEEVLPSGVH